MADSKSSALIWADDDFGGWQATATSADGAQYVEAQFKVAGRAITGDVAGPQYFSGFRFNADSAERHEVLAREGGRYWMAPNAKLKIDMVGALFVRAFAVSAKSGDVAAAQYTLKVRFRAPQNPKALAPEVATQAFTTDRLIGLTSPNADIAWVEITNNNPTTDLLLSTFRFVVTQAPVKPPAAPVVEWRKTAYGDFVTNTAVDEAMELNRKPYQLPPVTRVMRCIAAVGHVRNLHDNEGGSGFMVTPHLFVTNNHVIPRKTSAGENTTIYFGLEGDQPNDKFDDFDKTKLEEYECVPNEFFATVDEKARIENAQPDFTIVAIRPKKKTAASGSGSGGGSAAQPALIDSKEGGRAHWIPLKAGSVSQNGTITVIGHPQGLLKRISTGLHSPKAGDDGMLSYNTETDVGSSGGPTLNRDWELVAVHRRTDAGGKATAANPKPTNKGVLIASITDFLSAKPEHITGADPKVVLRHVAQLGSNAAWSAVQQAFEKYSAAK